MPAFGSGFDDQTPEQMAHTSCIASQWISRDKTGGYWNGESITICAAYVLLPAVILVLIAGYANTLRDLVSGYFGWVRHGSTEKGHRPRTDDPPGE